ncbi:EF-hand domain-containing protein [Nonomuraea sp. NPDC004297]
MSENAAYRLARLQARFALLDVTGDGQLRAEDFDRLAERVINALGMDRNSDKAHALVTGCRTYWQGLAGATDEEQGGAVTFDAYSATTPDSDHFDVYGQPYARALVALADRNDDGYVEPADFLACMSAIGFDLQRVKELFNILSRKGRIATGDWQKAIKDYYVNDSPDVPGQLLSRRSL